MLPQAIRGVALNAMTATRTAALPDLPLAGGGIRVCGTTLHAACLGGTFTETFAIGALTFRHKPSPDAPGGEIAGHLHPVARVAQRGRAVSRRCFATDGKALVMPAFGAYTGGLNVRDRAFAAVFGARKFTAHMLGDNQLYAFTASRCLPD